jgi:putative ABC transport system permease protein
MALVTGVTCSAGLLWQSLRNVAAIRPAMDPERPLLLVGGTWMGRPRIEDTAARMAQTPGVRQVAWARRALLSKNLGAATVGFEPAGQPKLRFHFNQVSPGYFAVTGARILSGRGFTEGDGPQSTPVMMVNQTFVGRFFEGRDPLSQWLRADGKDRQVVGVVEDGPTMTLRERIEPYFYFPFAQKPDGEMTYFIAAADPGALAGPVRDLLRASAREFRFGDMVTLSQHMSLARTQETRMAIIVGSLAALGLFLAAAGLFGVTMFAVARRIPEFGIRMAMGASPARVAAQVLRQAALRVAIALPLGWMVAWGGRQAIQKMLYGIAPDDPSIFLGASVVVAFVGCAAALRPAVRAARVDPMTALRHD